MEEHREWKKVAKSGNISTEFRMLQRLHRRLHEVKGPGLGVAVPHQTFYTKNSEAGEFMRDIVISSVRK
jgi:hypothetical protein